MSENRYDVIYESSHRCYLRHHFCREYDCYGTNSDHGYIWEEARLEVANFYQSLADEWRNKKEEDGE